MNLLLIDSTKTELTVALGVDGVITKKEICTEQRQHDKNINPLIKNLGVSNFDAVAVVTGPGSWTGIRVGLATAKAFSFVKKIPIIELTDKIDIDVAMQKYTKKDYKTAFTVKPFYNGEFVVNKKN